MRKSVFYCHCLFAIVYVVTKRRKKTAPFWGKQEVYLMNQTEKRFI